VREERRLPGQPTCRQACPGKGPHAAGGIIRDAGELLPGLRGKVDAVEGPIQPTRPAEALELLS
jgi:hypothetical protein